MSLADDYDWADYATKLCPHCGAEFELFNRNDVFECPNCGTELEEEAEE